MGISERCAAGCKEGAVVLALGVVVGDTEGSADAGESVGIVEGAAVGDAVGSIDGFAVGVMVASGVGMTVGSSVVGV